MPILGADCQPSPWSSGGERIYLAPVARIGRVEESGRPVRVNGRRTLQVIRRIPADAEAGVRAFRRSGRVALLAVMLLLAGSIRDARAAGWEPLTDGIDYREFWLPG